MIATRFLFSSFFALCSLFPSQTAPHWNSLWAPLTALTLTRHSLCGWCRRMNRAVAVVCLVAVVGQLVAPAVAVTLAKCTVAKDLYNAGISKSLIPDWLCLIQHESAYNTAATNVNTNGSKDNGIFQINDTYWCSETAKGKDCNLKCSSLLDSDITDDIACAKIIYGRQGFNAWYGWINYCQGVTLPSISDCTF